MEPLQSFDLPVTYKGKEYSFPASLVQRGYAHRIEVDVDGTPVYFEWDEERKFRALIDPDAESSSTVDPGLVQALMQTLEALLG
ncbi:hypothetical protein [Flaviaesturariibacter amylovorans]|uniref:Uncharacterized protein n=1 Tax=Flaviaesturariibacter amylovorans TaxID=1084520 RepID=A0ABP8GBU9_9BACT